MTIPTNVKAIPQATATSGNVHEFVSKLAPVGLLTSAEAAKYLGLAEGTLIKERCTRTMRIPFVRIGRAVRYRREDLDKFIVDNLHNA